MSELDAGYAIYERVFAPSDMRHALEQLRTASLERTRAGARHVLEVAVVRALAGHARLTTIASRFVGGAPVPFRATLFDKSTSANWLIVWHQDTALPLCRRFDQRGWGPWSRKRGVLHAHAPSWALEQVIALRISLDDSTLSNGPLRVLPDTHAWCAHRWGGGTPGPRDRGRAMCDGVGGVMAMRPLRLAVRR